MYLKQETNEAVCELHTPLQIALKYCECQQRNYVGMQSAYTCSYGNSYFIREHFMKAGKVKNIEATLKETTECAATAADNKPFKSLAFLKLAHFAFYNFNRN